MKDWLKLLTQYPGSVMPLAYPITSYISLTRWRYQEPRVTTAFTLEKNYFAHSQKMKLFSWITQFWCILMHFFWFLDNFLFWKVPGLLHCGGGTWLCWLVIVVRTMVGQLGWSELEVNQSQWYLANCPGSYAMGRSKLGPDNLLSIWSLPAVKVGQRSFLRRAGEEAGGHRGRM